MKPSVELAEEHFRTKVLPRRILEKVELVQTKSGELKQRKRYRKANRDEVGELYPYFELNIRSMAQFGLGVSVYLLQLVIMAMISFIAGVIMIPAIIEYATNIDEKVADARLIGSATCENPKIVNATCNNDDLCEARFREDCPLHQTNVICDIIMSLLLLIIFYLNMGVEEVEDRMDEVIQTAQDYSVVVRDPPPSIRKPDDYHVFFQRFGRVKNITVTKKNKHLAQLLLQKQMILRQIDIRLHDKVRDITEYTRNNQQKHSCFTLFGQNMGYFRDEDYWINQLINVNKKLKIEYTKVYDTCRVYVSFETEAEQRLCLKELNVSILQSISNVNDSGKDRILFGDKDVLSVLESAEPNNILWENLEDSWTERTLRFIGAWIFSLLTMAASFFAIQETYQTNPALVPIVIGLIDSGLPTIFLYITIFEHHIDEDDKQNSLMFKLYGARLLTSVFFTYANTQWNAFLDEAQLTNILNIQLSASFVSPMIKAMDLYGVTMRWIVSPLVSNTQAEMNCYWEGTFFTLADRYTELSKIIFISLFYSFLVPFGLFVSTIACIVLFCVDRYLLFRKTRPPPMLDATMAASMRNYLIFAVGFHMYVTTRFIYSWPFDSASWSENNDSYIQINKEADYNILKLKPQSWHSDVQHDYFLIYKWITIIVIGIMGYVFLLEPLKDFIFAFFCGEAKVETATSSSKPYSSIAGIVAYCPTINYGTERFIIADTRKMLTRHKPETITIISNEQSNLGEMIPEEKREDLLAVVKWYSDGTECEILEEQKIDEDMITSVIKSSLPTINPRIDSTKKNIVNEKNPIKSYLSMTSSTPDIIHIDIESPDIRSNNNSHVPQSTLELIAQREMEGSRIRRSRNKQKNKNSASILPINENESNVNHENKNDENDDQKKTNEPVVFTRDEVYLLRQLRKEFLSITIKDILANNDLSDPQTIYINYEEYLEILRKVAPDGLRRVCQNSSGPSTNKSMNEIMKLHRSILRRIYLKFLILQNNYKSTTGSPTTPGIKTSTSGDTNDVGKINLSILIEFIQHGRIINVHREQTQQSLLKK